MTDESGTGTGSEIGPYTKSLVNELEGGHARSSDVPSLSALLRTSLPVEVRAFLEAWNAHVIQDLRVGVLVFDDAFLAESTTLPGAARPVEKIVVIGQRSRRTRTTALVIDGLDQQDAAAQFKLLDDDTWTWSSFEVHLRERSEPTLTAIVAAIEEGAPRSAPSPEIARVLASTLPADLLALFTAWQAHAVRDIRVGGLALGDRFLRPVVGYERHGHGYNAELGPSVSVAGALHFGEWAHSRSTDWIGFRNPRSGVASDILYEGDQHRTMTGLGLEAVLEAAHRAAIEGERRYLDPLARSICR